MPLFGMSIGFPDPARPAAIKPRLPQAVVLHRERYAPAAEMEHVADYDRTLGAFSQTQGMARATWTDRIFARMAVIEGMTGRERMRAMMKALGFELR
jgi:hypothetical protein